MYRVEFTQKALKSLKKIDRKTQAILSAWIEKHLENCTNPYQYEKSLIGNRSQKWSYRIGDYRIIADIQEEKFLFLFWILGTENLFMSHIKTFSSTSGIK